MIIDILENDINIGHAIICDYTQPYQGTVVLNANNTFTYTPNPGYCGIADIFTYTLCEPYCNESMATVTVDIAC